MGIKEKIIAGVILAVTAVLIYFKMTSGEETLIILADGYKVITDVTEEDTRDADNWFNAGKTVFLQQIRAMNDAAEDIKVDGGVKDLDNERLLFLVSTDGTCYYICYAKGTKIMTITEYMKDDNACWNPEELEEAS